VEREMEREVREEKREEEDLRVVELAGRSVSPRPGKEMSPKKASDQAKIFRVILSEPRRGRIVVLKVFYELGIVCVLRDVG
jgi:hypothetical protein